MRKPLSLIIIIFVLCGSLLVSASLNAQSDDVNPPVISNVFSTDVTSWSATITWVTDEKSDSQVEFGFDTNYGNTTTLDPALVTDHSMQVSGLISNTTYHYRVISKDSSGNTAVSGDFISTTAITNGRVTDGLIAFYPFTEGSGTIVQEQSSLDTTLNLEILGDGVTWLDNRNGVNISSNSRIRSVEPPSQLHSQIVSSKAFAVEIWCKPANLTQDGPARMVSYAPNTSVRNFAMGQRADSMQVRLRTTITDEKGFPYMNSSSIVTTTESHYVLTYTAGGMEKLYKDGVEVVSEERLGDLSNWDPSYFLTIANLATGERPWLGEVYLVAIYNRELSVSEIQQNYNHGPILTPPAPNQAPQAPILISPEERTFLNDLSTPIKLVWGVPNDANGDSLHFKVEIDDDPTFNSPLLVFDSNLDPGGFVPVPPVAQTTDSVTFELSSALQDGQYWWRVTAWDGALFGAPSAPRSFIVDTTLPDIIEIGILNPDFEPNWFNQGITSTAQLNLVYTEQYLQQLRMVAEGLGTTIEVQDVQSGESISVPFDINIAGTPDGSYELQFILVDSAGNTRQASETIALDNTPPEGARANAPLKSDQEKFVVSWGGTATDGNGSGISGIYDVRVQINDGPWLPWLTNFLGTSKEFIGTQGSTYGFEVASHDNVGNVELFLEIPEAVTVVDTGFVDTTPPFIFHTPVTVVDEGQDVNIEAQVQDNNQVAEVTLFYKQSGKTAFQSLAMNDMGSGLYQATLSSDQVSTKGVNYYIRVSDGVNFTYNPSENWDTKPNNISVRILGTNSQGLLKDQAQPGGSTQSAFRMISVPLTVASPQPQSVLEDDLGPYDPKQWRLFQYNPLTEDYNEFPNIDTFSPGSAFWLIIREPNKQIDSGIGTTVATNQSFQITLQQGWNDIGNPFTFPVNWSSSVEVVQGSVTDIMGPYTFNGQWLLPDQVTTLFPWDGYSIFSQTQGVVIAIHPIDANQSGASLAKNRLQVDWQLQIEAVCQKTFDGTNFIGVSTDALEEWDHFDYLEPPYINEYVSVTFPHDEWQTFRGAFTTDYRPPFTEGQVWHFEVQTDIKNASIALTFKNLDSLPPNFRAVLLDVSTIQQIDLLKNPEYNFVPDQTSLTREFDLIIGTDSFIQDSDLISKITPKEFSLSQNFPNPFNAGTTLLYKVPVFSHVSIKVLNILGQEVRQLVSQQQEPGVYRINWDGKSQDGRDASSGVYLVRFEAGDFHQSRKVILIR